MLLSSLSVPRHRSSELEQYSTDGDLAARWLTDIAAFGDLQEGCWAADLGTGNGILGIGAMLMGAGRATLVESDQTACDVAIKNTESMGFMESIEVIRATVGSDQISLGNVDLLICNPPWGRQLFGADRPFFDEIIKTNVPSHLMHSSEAKHIGPIFEDSGWSVERYGEADFSLPATYSHHSRERGKTRAAFWRLSPP
tara:strand:+ start:3199 stop:3792 length:594 start_codon:yes stop_codon:yes gene_type:complete